MNKFFGTVILVIIASFITFLCAELREANEEKRTGTRQFSLKENAKYSLLAYSVIAILIWR